MIARQRPIAVTAEQFTDVSQPPEGVCRAYVRGSPFGRDDGHPDGWELVARFGRARIYRGDWVITWPDGSRTACTDAHFAMCFERPADPAVDPEYRVPALGALVTVRLIGSTSLVATHGLTVLPSSEAPRADDDSEQRLPDRARRLAADPLGEY